MFKKSLLVLLMLYTVSLSCLMAEKAEPFMIIDDQVQKTLELLQTTQQQTMPAASDSVTITKDKLVLALKQSGMNDEQVDFVLKRIEEFVALKSSNTKIKLNKNKIFAVGVIAVLGVTITGILTYKLLKSEQQNQQIPDVYPNNNRWQQEQNQDNNPVQNHYNAPVQGYQLNDRNFEYDNGLRRPSGLWRLYAMSLSLD